MNRRSFLSALAALPGLGFLARPTVSHPATPPFTVPPQGLEAIVGPPSLFTARDLDNIIEDVEREDLWPWRESERFDAWIRWLPRAGGFVSVYVTGAEFFARWGDHPPTASRLDDTAVSTLLADGQRTLAIAVSPLAVHVEDHRRALREARG